MMGRDRSRRPADRGAAAVEFALVVIPLLYLVLGVISYGYILSFRQAISQAAAEGARAAAVAPSGYTSTQQQDAARAAVNGALDTYGVSCAATGLMKGGVNVGACTIGVAICANDPSKSCVSVKLDYLYRSNPLIPLPGLGLVVPQHLTYTAVAEVS